MAERAGHEQRDGHPPARIVKRNADHRAKEGRSVYVRDGYLTLAMGDDEEPLVDIALLTVTPAGCPAYQIENLPAAVAAAWALDLPADMIRTGVLTYELDEAVSA